MNVSSEERVDTRRQVRLAAAIAAVEGNCIQRERERERERGRGRERGV